LKKSGRFQGRKLCLKAGKNLGKRIALGGSGGPKIMILQFSPKKSKFYKILHPASTITYSSG